MPPFLRSDTTSEGYILLYYGGWKLSMSVERMKVAVIFQKLLSILLVEAGKNVLC